MLFYANYYAVTHFEKFLLFLCEIALHMRRLILLILCLSLLVGCNSDSGLQDEVEFIPEQDREAVLSLYRALGGEQWTVSTNWGSERPLEEWYGLYTYQGRVYAIDLSANNLSGTLPEAVSTMDALKYLNLSSNNITGSIPECYGELQSLAQLSLYNNRMSGEIPASLCNTPGWNYTWGYAIVGNRYNRFNLYGCGITAPTLSLTLTDGQTLSVDSDYYARNRYTILFQWSDEYTEFLPTLKTIYDRYRGFGLDIVSWTPSDSKVAEYAVEWPVAQVSEDCPLSEYNDNYYPVGLYPTVTMFDSAGRLVFSDTVESRGNIVSVVDALFADIVNADLYTSTDFSADGTVHTLQRAIEGKGIDIVIMGDGFSDRMIADGRYAERMTLAADALFSQAPMSHFRELFNVYYVDVVSANECFAFNATTALRSQFGEGTLITGDDKRCFDYAQKATDTPLDDLLVVVVLNSDRYAGTTYMYYPQSVADGAGGAIAYVPIGQSEEMFTALVCHEAVGHGFAKLDDEYILEGMGAMPLEHKDFRKSREEYGWLKNTDVYHHPRFVKWSHLLLPRYVSCGLGAYEGAASYATGIYRPTEQSIMNMNVGGFNPPSREAIYRRIHNLAYGEKWNYDLEAFLNYDLTNILSDMSQITVLSSENQLFMPTHSPIMRSCRTLYR